MGTAAGWLFFLLLLTAVGAAGTRWLILPRPPDMEDPLGLRVATARIGLIATVGLLPALIALLHRQVQEFRFPGDPWLGAAQTLLGTSWGDAWGLASGAAVLGALGFGAASLRRPPISVEELHRVGWIAATVALLPLVFFPGRTGHAAAAEAPILALSLDALHVVAAGLWIGGLGILVLLAWWGERGPGILARLVPRFSPVAMVSVGMLFASGAWAGWRELAAPDALWQTGYGRLLAFKVALVGGVLVLGAFNWRRVGPSLGSEAGDRTMRRTATVEFLLANVVLVVTSILVRTSP